MDLQQHIPLWAVIVPIIAGVLMTVIRRERITLYLHVASIGFTALAHIVLLHYLMNSETSAYIYHLGSAGAPWVNTFSIGYVEIILGLVFSLVLILSVWGGLNEMQEDISVHKRYLYYFFINIVYASLLVLVYTNDIFTAYVFLEINTIVACLIIVINESGATILATIKYFVMAAVGSGLFLFSIAILYSITGHLAISHLHEAIQMLYQSGTYRLPLMMTLILFFVSLATKAALFPFHNWLPDAHSSATPSSSAILSGLVLKGYIVFFIKVVYRIYGVEVVRGLNMFPIILGFGILSMIAGSILALQQRDVKKMIAYSSVSQMGYIFAGIGLGTTAGLVAATFHMLAHAITKSSLFITAGKMIHKTGERDIRNYGGLGRIFPWTFGLFAIGGLSMIGIPPLAGFTSKWTLGLAALEGQHYSLILFITLSTLLNVAYYLPIIIRSFFNEAQNESMTLHSDVTEFDTNYIAIILLVVGIVMLGVWGGQIMNILAQGYALW